jgi:hypothetical protein
VTRFARRAPDDHPDLIAFIDGEPRLRLAAPEQFAARAWILGVVAVQATVADGRVRARLRAHTTGAAAPTLLPLGDRACVHVALVAPGAPPPPALPGAAPPPDAAGGAVLALSVDGEPVAAASLGAAALHDSPPPRAFGHVFCRWLRDGGAEPGCDLTRFAPPIAGAAWPRLAVRTLRMGQIVEYVIRPARAD